MSILKIDPKIVDGLYGLPGFRELYHALKNITFANLGKAPNLAITVEVSRVKNEEGFQKEPYGKFIFATDPTATTIARLYESHVLLKQKENPDDSVSVDTSDILVAQFGVLNAHPHSSEILKEVTAAAKDNFKSSASFVYLDSYADFPDIAKTMLNHWDD